MSQYDDIADQIRAIETQVSELIFNTVRAQLRGDDSSALETEKRLSKVRRSLQKAEHLLRGAVDN